jgi:AhpD family alkylhydroperoxidase
MYSGRETLPYLGKTLPEAGKAATAHATALSEEALRQGPACTESELIKLRLSQLNGCLFRRNLRSRQSRHAGVTQQKLDLSPAWQDASLCNESLQGAGSSRALDNRSRNTVAPEDEHQGEPVAAHSLLPDGTFVAGSALLERSTPSTGSRF